MGNDYRNEIAEGLSDALGRAEPLEWDVNRTRLVIFSDLHRGYGDHADDFRKCRDTYHRALDYYFESSYALLVLGDSEEFWECRPRKVLETYSESFANEARFCQNGEDRYTKVWGNHDDLWRNPIVARKHLAEFFGENPFPECLDVTVKDAEEILGRIFLVHGHQGTPGSDKWEKYSRPIVRWVWRPIQRLFKISLTTPANSFEIRGKHDRAMYDWAADRNDLVLIAGHTHRPVFVSKPNVETIERIYSDVLGPSPEGIAGKPGEEQLLARKETRVGEGRIEGRRPRRCRKARIGRWKP